MSQHAGASRDAAHGRPGRSGRGCLLAAVVVTLALAGGVVGVGMLPRDYRGSGTIGLIILVVGGFVAWVIQGWSPRGLLLAVTVGLAAGITLLRVDSTMVVGALLCGAAVALIPPTVAELGRKGLAERPRPANPRTLLVTSTAGVLFVAFAFGLIGVTQRATFEYVKRHGELVEVTLPKSCTEYSSVRRISRTVCEGSTWQAAGRTVTGTLTAAEWELRDKRRFTSLTGSRTIGAVALGGTAFTERYGEVESGIWKRGRYYRLGLVPPSLMIPFPLLLAALVLVASFRKRIARHAHQARTAG